MKNKKIVIASITLVVIIVGLATVKLVNKNNKQNVTMSSQDETAPKISVVNDLAQQDKLEPLPADDKQAIDSELGSIDKELKFTDDSVKSSDLSNSNLGL